MVLEDMSTDVYDANGVFLESKTISTYLHDTNVIEWLRRYYDKNGEHIGYLRMNGTNVQNNIGIYLASELSDNDIHNHFYANITKKNVGIMCVYLAIRQCIEATWKNDREQYLMPNDRWQKDTEFQTDCLIYTLFHGQNRISSEHGVNHWIPFTEEEVDAKEKFESHFISDFIHGRIKKTIRTEEEQNEFEKDSKNYHVADAFAEPTTTTNLQDGTTPLVLSDQAKSVMDAGLKLWRYYHQQPIAKEKPNASFYDIRLYFQGTKNTKSGKQQMNTESDDPTYTALITNLRQRQKELAKQIEPKIYEYGFLKK